MAETYLKTVRTEATEGLKRLQELLEEHVATKKVVIRE